MSAGARRLTGLAVIALVLLVVAARAFAGSGGRPGLEVRLVRNRTLYYVDLAGGNGGNALSWGQEVPEGAAKVVEARLEARYPGLVETDNGRDGLVVRLPRPETPQERDAVLQLLVANGEVEQRQVLEVTRRGDLAFDDLKITCARTDMWEGFSCSYAPALAARNVVYPSRDGATKYRLGPVELDGSAIESAEAVEQTTASPSAGSRWVVEFLLTEESSSEFANVTSRLVGYQLAVVVDREVIAAPTIREPITGGAGEISGSFTEVEARDLTALIEGETLHTQLEVDRVRNVTLSDRPSLLSLLAWAFAGAALIAAGVLLLRWQLARAALRRRLREALAEHRAAADDGYDALHA